MAIRGLPSLEQLLGNTNRIADFEDAFVRDPRAGIQALSPYLGSNALALLTNPSLVSGEMERRELFKPGTGHALGVLTDEPRVRELVASLSPFQRGERPEAFRGWHRRIIRR